MRCLCLEMSTGFPVIFEIKTFLMAMLDVLFLSMWFFLTSFSLKFP